MATLILSTVGTALGGPIGGAIGAVLGRVVDSAVIGTPTRQGPRCGGSVRKSCLVYKKRNVL